jgi:hypothetical protein
VREEERHHRPTTENTQRRLFVFVLNLRALISSRARVSLSLALLFREKKRRKRRRSTKRNRERHRNDRPKEEDEEDKRKRRARDDDIVVTSFSKGNSGHRKLSLHFPFRVFKLSEKKIREKDNTNLFFFFF